MTQRDVMGREVGGGFMFGNACIPVGKKGFTFDEVQNLSLLFSHCGFFVSHLRNII